MQRPNDFAVDALFLHNPTTNEVNMKRLLAIAALTVFTASSAFAATSNQGWRAQAVQSYGSTEMAGSQSWRAQSLQSYAADDRPTLHTRDSSTRPYFGFGHQTNGSSIVQ
jgi:hypothetical protein